MMTIPSGILPLVPGASSLRRPSSCALRWAAISLSLGARRSASAARSSSHVVPLDPAETFSISSTPTTPSPAAAFSSSGTMRRTGMCHVGHPHLHTADQRAQSGPCPSSGSSGTGQLGGSPFAAIQRHRGHRQTPSNVTGRAALSRYALTRFSMGASLSNGSTSGSSRRERQPVPSASRQ